MSEPAPSVVHVIRSDGFAGVEKHVARLASAQAVDGWRVAVIGGGGVPMHQEWGGSRVPHREAVTLLDTVRRLDEFRGVDLVHAHMTAAETAAVLSPRMRHVPLVVTRHFAAPRGGSALGRLVAPLIRRRLSAQIAISDYVARSIDGASTVIYPGVPSAPDLLPGAQREPTVLVAQRLEPEKRTEDAVRAFAASGLAAGGWQLAIAGSGSQAPALRRLADALGVSQATRFLGHRSDVPELMASASMLLATCDVEGLGLSLLEAMALGLPVVASSAGAHLETVGGVDGAALYPPGDAEAAGALLAALAASADQRRVYGRGLQQAQRARFSIAAQAEQTEALYRSLL